MIRNRGRARPDAPISVPDNPARGQAQGRIISLAKRAPGRWTADGSEAQKSTPSASSADRFFRSGFSPTGGRSPRRKSIGAEAGARTTSGPGPAEMPKRQVGRRELATCQAAGFIRRECPPGCGINPAKGAVEPHERRRTTEDRREGPASSGQAELSPWTGSGTPREEGAIWRMTHFGRRSHSEGA